jgi:hypothetical protein
VVETEGQKVARCAAKAIVAGKIPHPPAMGGMIWMIKRPVELQTSTGLLVLIGKGFSPNKYQ